MTFTVDGVREVLWLPGTERGRAPDHTRSPWAVGPATNGRTPRRPPGWGSPRRARARVPPQTIAAAPPGAAEAGDREPESRPQDPPRRVHPQPSDGRENREHAADDDRGREDRPVAGTRVLGVGEGEVGEGKPDQPPPPRWPPGRNHECSPFQLRIRWYEGQGPRGIAAYILRGPVVTVMGVHVPDHLLFSYGPCACRRSSGPGSAASSTAAPTHLLGFRLETVKITDASVVADSGSDEHPVAVPSDNPSDYVEGMVFTLTPQDLAAADAYEVDDYLRVKADLRSGEKAWVYVDAATAEEFRAGRLLSAQANAITLFDEIVKRDLIAAGRREREISDAIRDLADEMFGTTRHWHKRIVRSGPNTLFPYRENPPDRAVEADDIVFCDFGPIFEEFEADLEAAPTSSATTP